MRACDRQDVERSELEAVLKSGILERAPAMAQILTYVCELHFSGRSGEIKEYNIAVDGLGRPPGFNPKQDSIVRVEAHRLRKRLGEYYAGDGAGHDVRIVIPPGQYVPQFVHRNGHDEAIELPPKSDKPAKSRKMRVAAQSGAAVALLSVAVILFWPRSSRPDRSANVTPHAGPQIRLVTGPEMYADALGRVWQADRFATGGRVAPLARTVLNTRDPDVYSFYREGAFRYDIPLAPGVYEMRLHFIEPLFGREGGIPGGEGSRLVQVSMNGKPLLQDLDIFAEAGPLSPDVKAFKDVSPAADGKLHLEFGGTSHGAVLCAIEITPGIPGVMMPIRMVSRDTPYTDKQGRTWDPDRYVTGGRLVFRTSPITAADDAELYRGERYGALTYRIPVPPGRYDVILRFCETWFGASHPAGGGRGSRLFDILCNGTFLERKFDVFQAAGGSDRGLRRVYRNIEPNPQRMIVLSLLPRANYAELNALEVRDAAQ
jgi:Malectin domain